jgi:hypothetical protein
VRRAAIALGIALTLGAGAAMASDITTEWAGVYKTRFQNGNNFGDRYESENILEIVRLDAESAYVRAHLEFSNGHGCSLYVIATVEGDQLVYREPNPPSYRGQCVLSLSRENGEMRFNEPDESDCALAHCGARGAFRSQSMPVSSQRRIRYMDRLLASREHAEAMREAGRAP